MTPFDPIALLVMLRTFYPVASVAALQRALRERPEYFAGGVLVSTSGEKLRLPDGRIFDLIYDVDGFSGGPLWQVIEPGPGGEPDPFPLEPGPLGVLDPNVALPPPLEFGFAALAAAHLGDVERSAVAIEGYAGEIVAGGTGAGFDAAYEDSAGRGRGALENHLRAFGDLDPSAVMANTGGLTGRISDAQADLPDPDATAPPEIDVDPSPRDDPPREGPEAPWYQQ